jgi:4-amino-4-deoxy-L-arabinose transferase-like glycosyltransferase
VLATALRLPALSSKPLWYDEAFAVLFAATGPKAMAYGTLAVEQGVAADVHPIGYYSLLWSWMSLFGSSGMAVRLLSVILGVVTVYVGYRLASWLFGSRLGGMAGLALAIAPFQVHYSQEVRMYALMALLLLGAALMFRRACLENRLRDWAAFAILSALAQYTHTLSAFFLLPLALIPLWERHWKNARRTVLAGLGALVLYLPWLLYLPSQLSRLRWAYWIPEPGAVELVRTWIVFVAGSPIPQWGLGLLLFGTVLASVIAAVGTFRAWRARSELRSGLWLLYLALAPTALMFAFSAWQPVYLERALLTSGAMFVLWLVWALGRPELANAYRWTGAAALIITMLLGLVGYYSYRGFPYAPFEELNIHLSEIPSGEAIIHSNKISALPASYYDPSIEHRYLADPPGSGSDTLAPATQQVLDLIAERSIETAAGRASGLWLVMFPREESDYQAQGYLMHPDLEWLDEHYRLEQTLDFGELRAYHYLRQ